MARKVIPSAPVFSRCEDKCGGQLLLPLPKERSCGHLILLPRAHNYADAFWAAVFLPEALLSFSLGCTASVMTIKGVESKTSIKELLWVGAAIKDLACLAQFCDAPSVPSPSINSYSCPGHDHSLSNYLEIARLAAVQLFTRSQVCWQGLRNKKFGAAALFCLLYAFRYHLPCIVDQACWTEIATGTVCQQFLSFRLILCAETQLTECRE